MGAEAVAVLPSPQLTVMSDPDIGRVIDSSAAVVLQVVANASAGSVVSDDVISILMIWTPSSRYAVTAAYVLPPDLNVVMLIAPSSSRVSVSVMLSAAMIFEGSVTSRIWTPSSVFAVTAAYVWPPDLNMVMLDAPLSSRLPPSVMLSVAMMFEGSVTFSIWTPSSAFAATAAYVWPPDSNVVMPYALLSSRLPPSVMLSVAMIFEGSVTFNIWTPSSRSAATAAYVWPPDLNMVMLIAPLSSRVSVSVMLSVAMIFEGSVTFSIWTPSSSYAVTAAYVLLPDSNVVMLDAPLSSRLPPSVMLSVAMMFEGSVTFSIWTPSSSYAVTAAYVLLPDLNMVMPRALSSTRLSSSVMLSVAMIFEGSVTFSIWTPSSSYAVTAAYVWPPDLNVVMSCAPLSSRSLPVILSVGVRLNTPCTA